MSHTGKGKFLPVLLAVLCIALAVILAAGAVLIYLDGAPRRAENPLENIYTAEKAGRVMAAALPVFLALLCVLAACLILGVKPPKAKGETGGGKASPASGELKHETWIRIAVFAAAVLLIIAGIANGSVQDVLAKAISICTECVGLG